MALLDSVSEKRTDCEELAFGDIPWPVLAAYHQRRVVGTTPNLRVDDLTTEAVATFLSPAPAGLLRDTDGGKKVRKDKLKEAMRRFHPDKFEGRFIHRVRRENREMVIEGIGQVSRILNSLMAEP